MTGDRRHHRARADARVERELGELVVAHRCDVVGAGETRANGGFAQGFDGEPAPVIGDLDADATAFGRRDRHRHAAAPRLAGRLALVGGLDPVIDRVANHVNERILDQGQHFAIDFEMLAAALPGDILARHAAELAHHEREALK